ncbi:MAG: alternative ribosome rescue aminoacyl-tRNA hydrolase ArfB [Chloroflexota bacterium]|nr:aminoacyl-tRNA hydrolase [Chloroflexota bacterium]MBI5702694.1 aminoacyl-tRNA hydrolase [Chloroflexota bacterium]
MLEITPTLQLDERELQFDYLRASGPGGQNVNKVATAVQLRFDVVNSPSLASDLKGRLLRLAGKRINADGVLIIEARRFRTQEANRADALRRFVELLQKAAVPPKPRRKTKPTAASREKRLQEKKRKGEVKRTRGKTFPLE